MLNKKKKVAVAISGGVDSSLSAYLLQKEGYEVIGIFMRLGIDQETAENSARAVCRKLNIKFYPIDIAGKFKEEIVDCFLEEYESGVTPNPCVRCNKLIKFGEFFIKARELGVDYFATGHYVRLEKDKKGRVRVFRGADPNKDQSYFLYNLTQDILEHIMFPLGESLKTDVKKRAEKNDLPNLKFESQDVCFLPDDHNVFLRDNLKLKPGPIKTIDEDVVGSHQGLPLYTIGQRRGIEIGGIGPFYVARMDYKTNTLYVVNDKNHPLLFSDALLADSVNWISGDEPALPFECEAVIRYRHEPIKCTISKRGEKLHVKFEKNQRAITPGQSVVFYSGNELLGGGIIIAE